MKLITISAELSGVWRGLGLGLVTGPDDEGRQEVCFIFLWFAISIAFGRGRV